MLRLSRLGRGLIALRSPVAIDKVRAGQLLRVGETGSAAVLCSRGGTLVASVLPGGEALGSEASMMAGQVLHGRLGSGALLGGRVIDYLGNELDGGAPASAPEVPLFGTPPSQSELRPIERSLHTGSVAIDALTPIGRGQSMMVFGEAVTGKSTIGWDACLAQAASDVHCILALSSGGAARALSLLEQLRRRGDDELAARWTIVTTPGEDGSDAERLLVLAAAAAVGEAVRDGGSHALVVADELNGMCDVWDVAGEAVASLGGPPAGAASDRLHSAEQRIFYASWLQRASQLTSELGGGSLTLLGMLRQLPRPTATSSSASVDVDESTLLRAFELRDFASRPPAERSRVEAILARGVKIDEEVLLKVGIRPPTRDDAPSPSTDETSSSPSSPAASEAPAASAHDAYVRSVMHTDQLTSLCDGHIQLTRELFLAGRRPATLPSDSLARVGAGSELSENRAQPATPAMRRVAQYLRLELAQARDLLPADPSDSPVIRQQRVRAAALEALLTSQRSGEPFRLSHEIVMLHCLAAGHLDHLADAPSDTHVRDAVDALTAHVDAAMAQRLVQIDRTGEIDEDTERALLACAAEVLPAAAGRAFFTNYDATSWTPAEA